MFLGVVMTDSFHSANAETCSVQLPAPEVLEIIRTAAADCRVAGNAMAQNELLTASIMARGMLEALQSVIAVAERRKSQGKEMPTLDQWRAIERVVRAAATRAQGGIK
jgi:hypothetical protein